MQLVLSNDQSLLEHVGMSNVTTIVNKQQIINNKQAGSKQQ